MPPEDLPTREEAITPKILDIEGNPIQQTSTNPGTPIRTKGPPPLLRHIEGIDNIYREVRKFNDEFLHSHYNGQTRTWYWYDSGT